MGRVYKEKIVFHITYTLSHGGKDYQLAKERKKERKNSSFKSPLNYSI